MSHPCNTSVIQYAKIDLGAISPLLLKELFWELVFHKTNISNLVLDFFFKLQCTFYKRMYTYTYYWLSAFLILMELTSFLILIELTGARHEPKETVSEKLPRISAHYLTF